MLRGGRPAPAGLTAPAAAPPAASAQPHPQRHLVLETHIIPYPAAMHSATQPVASPLLHTPQHHHLPPEPPPIARPPAPPTRRASTGHPQGINRVPAGHPQGIHEAPAGHPPDMASSTSPSKVAWRGLQALLGHLASSSSPPLSHDITLAPTVTWRHPLALKGRMPSPTSSLRVTWHRSPGPAQSHGILIQPLTVA